MRYLSICSGIEAATVAWAPLGWEAAAFAEIDAFPSAVLEHRFPGIPNLGDINGFKKWKIGGAVDLLIGGTPCQSFSVAGLRKGLDDPRGNLALVFLAILERYSPRWFIWENVPGARSSYSEGEPQARESGDEFERWEQDEDRDLAAILAGFQKLGYGICWRSLDAQYFGVPQRRERLFVVGYLGDWRPAAAVLFEPESLRGDTPPSRKAGQGFAGDAPAGAREPVCAEVAPTISSSGPPFSRTGNSRTEAEALVAYQVAFNDANGTRPDRPEGGAYIRETKKAGALTQGRNDTVVVQPFEVANALTARMSKGINTTVDEGQTPVLAFSHCDDGRDVCEEHTPTLRARNEVNANMAGGGQVAVAYDPNQVTSKANRSNPQPGDPCHTLPAVGVAPLLAGLHVRRLTPRECERLQGFPDDFTRVPYRGRCASKCADTPRYKALGNTMAVPVIRWLGVRIQRVDEILKEAA